MPILTRITFALLLLLHASSLNAEDSDDFGRRSGHPYLLYTDANIARLKERVQNEPIVAEAWQRILASANGALAPSQDTGGQGRRGGRGGTNQSTIADTVNYPERRHPVVLSNKLSGSKQEDS